MDAEAGCGRGGEAAEGAAHEDAGGRVLGHNQADDCLSACEARVDEDGRDLAGGHPQEAAAGADPGGGMHHDGAAGNGQDVGDAEPGDVQRDAGHAVGVARVGGGPRVRGMHHAAGVVVVPADLPAVAASEARVDAYAARPGRLQARQNPRQPDTGVGLGELEGAGRSRASKARVTADRRYQRLGVPNHAAPDQCAGTVEHVGPAHDRPGSIDAEVLHGL
mmetsp:Transcript_11297/g.31794  ORF Transcript_11297/g.31794 Transcript_11297/m.31794 type:complete len:220 (+) Transcript_11297:325-984(+)